MELCLLFNWFIFDFCPRYSTLIFVVSRHFREVSTRRAFTVILLITGVIFFIDLLNVMRFQDVFSFFSLFEQYAVSPPQNALSGLPHAFVESFRQSWQQTSSDIVPSRKTLQSLVAFWVLHVSSSAYGWREWGFIG